MTLALISGRGSLPAIIAAAQPERPLVCALSGFEPDGVAADITFRLEHLGSLLKDLSANGVTQVCFCGAIRRPPVDPKKLDAATLPLVPAILRALKSGDDAALRAVMDVFARRGFEVRAAHELVPDLLPEPGVLGAVEPDAGMREDAARGQAVLAALAPLDVGQACVVGGGQVWGIETAAGTDHMIANLPEAARDTGAVLIKTPKSGQDLRADMPSVGPGTITVLAQAGLRGLVIRAGQTLLLERAEMLARADAAQIVVWARERD